MVVDFGQQLKTIEGETLFRARRDRASNSTIEVPATLQWAAVEALLSTAPNESIPGEEKAKRYALALKIQESKEPIDLSLEEVVLVKSLCDAQFTPLVVGQVRRMLDAPKKD